MLKTVALYYTACLVNVPESRGRHSAWRGCVSATRTYSELDGQLADRVHPEMRPGSFFVALWLNSREVLVWAALKVFLLWSVASSQNVCGHFYPSCLASTKRALGGECPTAEGPAGPRECSCSADAIYPNVTGPLHLISHIWVYEDIWRGGLTPPISFLVPEESKRENKRTRLEMTGQFLREKQKDVSCLSQQFD